MEERGKLRWRGKHVKNVQHLENTRPIVCFLVLTLNQRYSIKIIQPYGQTSAYTNAEVKAFYDEVKVAMSNLNNKHGLI